MRFCRNIIFMYPNDFFSEQCSHMQAVRYYAESVIYPNNFIAVKCKDYDNFKKNFCGDKSLGYMGYGAVPTYAIRDLDK